MNLKLKNIFACNLFTLLTVLVGTTPSFASNYDCVHQGGGIFKAEGVYRDLNYTTWESAVRLFEIYRAHPSFQVTPENIQDGCNQRANHLISEMSNNYSLLSTQAYFQAEADDGFVGATGASYISGGADQGNVISITHQGRHYTWGYHTTAAFCVQKNGKVELYALDHILADEPIPLTEWHARLQDSYLGETHSFYFR